MCVTLNIVSASTSHQCTISRPRSPNMLRPMANSMLKMTICRTSPRAMASNTDVGTNVQDDLLP